MGAVERPEGKMEGSERSAGRSPWHMGEAFRA
jgi:hypothetical protein